MKQAARHTKPKADPNRYPKGLNRKKVQEIIEYYENQTDEEAIAEAEAAYKSPTSTMIQVPNELVPKVQKMIAKKRAS
jgi:response regulator of citrate/malate metabolism